MKKVVLIGNPNVGKSLVFSRITGMGVITANYAGTTVETKVGRFIYQGTEYELVDGPGIYSFQQFSDTDDTALKMVNYGDIIVNIIDSTNLERNLNLTLQLLNMHKPMIVCLNFWDDTLHKGISIDTVGLGKQLDLPVVTTNALSGEGITGLVSALSNVHSSTLTFDTDTIWEQIGRIVANVQKLSHRHHTLTERLSDFTLDPVGGLISAFVILVTMLGIIRFLGEGLINGILDPLFSQYYDPFIMNLSKIIPNDLIRGLLVGNTADPLQSFGILTSGVYIALVLVFPYFFSFYLIFGLLEDIGYLPRLAVVLDNLFHRLGLHGYSSIPVMLGLGCKVPAFMATRVLTNRREKLLTISIIFMSAPCLPQSSMIVSLGSHYGVFVVLAVFIILLVLSFSMNIILNRVFKGDLPDFFTEIPSYRVPSLKIILRKLHIRTADYFKEVLPMIVVGVLIINILDALKVISFITEVVKKPASILLGLPPDIAPIMLLGFLRKDVSIALLAPLNLSAHQFLVASIFLVLYIPCISSFFTLIKEVGIMDTLKIFCMVFITATAVAAIINVLPI